MRRKPHTEAERREKFEHREAKRGLARAAEREKGPRKMRPSRSPARRSRKTIVNRVQLRGPT